jgi:hypothetical protein
MASLSSHIAVMGYETAVTGPLHVERNPRRVALPWLFYVSSIFPSL